MAHFLEHMVFMGSEKYPKENDFEAFIRVSTCYVICVWLPASCLILFIPFALPFYLAAFASAGTTFT